MDFQGCVDLQNTDLCMVNYVSCKLNTFFRKTWNEPLEIQTYQHPAISMLKLIRFLDGMLQQYNLLSAIFP